VAIGNIAMGIPLEADGQYAGGLFGLLRPLPLLTGLLAVTMFTLQGAVWLTIRTDGRTRERALFAGRLTWFAFGALWIAVTLVSRSAAPHLWDNYAEPAAWVVPGLFLVASIGTGLALWRGGGSIAFLASSTTVAMLIGTLGVGLYPTIVPDGNGGIGLTIANAASSDLTLTVMLVIALVGMPLVLGYTFFIYRQFWGPVERGPGY
jgi:cytochrome d ubiquinol oxidase subunit II